MSRARDLADSADKDIAGTLTLDGLSVSGNVGIGTDSPSGLIHSYQGASGQTGINSSANGLVIEDNASNGISILTPSTAIGSIFFGDEADNFVGGLRYDHSNNSLATYVNNAERMRIDSSGNVLCGSDGGGDIGSSSKRFKDLYLSGGVYLGGTGSANYLDDYEEGTWTPVVTSNTAPSTVTLANQEGTYVKIGRQVTVEFKVSVTAWSGGGSFVIIGGLPFTTGFAKCRGAVTVQGITFDALWKDVHIGPRSSVQNHLVFIISRDNATDYNLLAGSMSGDETFEGSITYQTT